MDNKIFKILVEATDKTLATTIIESFKEVEKNFFIKSWKTSELDAGHFVEAVRRFIEIKLFGNYTPIGKNLQPLNDKTMQKYLNSPGDESYRIHIPRALLLVYGIRNKRGVGHLSKISPNRTDATIIMATVKWIFSELIRLNSDLTHDETADILNSIIERNVSGIWEQDDIIRILVQGLSIKEQIVFLLYNTKIDHDTELLSAIEYKNKNYFKNVLKQLHSERIIEYKNDGTCILSPKGSIFAEKIILDKMEL